jgi:hypothetical protein
VGPRAGLNGCGKSASTGIRPPDCSARSESLYRLRYPGPQINVLVIYMSVFSVPYDHDILNTKCVIILTLIGNDILSLDLMDCFMASVVKMIN